MATSKAAAAASAVPADVFGGVIDIGDNETETVTETETAATAQRVAAAAAVEKAAEPAEVPRRKPVPPSKLPPLWKLTDEKKEEVLFPWRAQLAKAKATQEAGESETSEVASSSKR